MGAHCSVWPHEQPAAAEASPAAAVVEAVEAALMQQDGEVPSLAQLCVRTLCAHAAVLDLPGDMPQEVNDAVLDYLCKTRQLSLRSLSKFRGQPLSAIKLGECDGVDDQCLEIFQFAARTCATELDLTDCSQITDNALAALSPLGRVQVVCLRNCFHLKEEFAKSLASATNLQVLSLNGCRQVTNNALVHLQDMTSLTDLDLRVCSLVNDDGIAALSNLTQLNALHLSYNRAITGRTLRTLTNFQQLRTLSLSYCKAITQEELHEVAALGTVRELAMSGCNVNDSTLEVLGNSLTSLERLDLAGCDAVTNIGIAHLRPTQLRFLNLTNCRRMTSLHRVELPYIEGLFLGDTRLVDSALAVLGNMSTLTELDLECTGIRSGLNHISALPLRTLNIAETKLIAIATESLSAITTLQVLDLGRCELAWQSMLFLRHLVNLKDLCLDSRLVDDLSIQPLQGLTKLERLDLFSSRVSDEGLLLLTGLQQLRSLQLCGGRVTDAGLAHIGLLTCLTYLNLSQNAGITCTGIGHLLQLKQLTALNLAYTSVGPPGLLQLTALRRLHSLTAYACELTPENATYLHQHLPYLHSVKC